MKKEIEQQPPDQRLTGVRAQFICECGGLNNDPKCPWCSGTGSFEKTISLEELLECLRFHIEDIADTRIKMDKNPNDSW